MLLVVVFHGVAIHDGLEVVLMADPHGSHLRWVFVLLFTNLLLYMVCCHSDPGELTSHDDLLQQSLVTYAYDGQLYQAGSVCSTCHIVRPARSKHCRVYDQCVYKFDHYCVWIGNCVGGLNHRYFVALLVSLCAMCLHAVYGIIKVFSAVTAVYHIQTTSAHQLIQVFVAHYPRLVILLVAVVNLAVITCAFAVYHVVLAATNQTVNERYKRYYLSHATATASVSNCYDRGVLLNLFEELFPRQHARLQSVRKST